MIFSTFLLSCRVVLVTLAQEETLENEVLLENLVPLGEEELVV